MTEPTQTVLTPAQVEMLETMLEDREARIIAYVNEAIAAALVNVVGYGGKIALRTSHGVTLCIDEGGPREEREPIEFESRLDVGPWESFTIERGQG